MANFYRYRLELSGWAGAPGVSILHSTTSVTSGDAPGDIGNFMNQIKNGWDSIKAYLSPGVVMTINPEVTEHVTETGLLVKPYNVTPPPPVTSTGIGGTGHISRATMAMCRHNTDLVSDRGSRVTGRTFVGPLNTTAMDDAGNILAAARAAFDAMWDGMQDVAGATRLVVWHRPAKAYIRDDGVSVPDSPGSQGHVQSTVTAAKPGSLRSRRD